MLNAPGARGLRLFPVPGEVITEIEALSLLTGATAELVAAGGVCGAEGSVWLAIAGSPEQEESAQRILKQVSGEPSFVLRQQRTNKKGSAEQDRSNGHGKPRH
jgi:hypothetical protein